MHRAGRSYLSVSCVTVPLYKFRKAAVMSKAFHGVINIWQNTWPFYQTNIFAVSFLTPWCEPCVTLHYRLLLLSRTVLSSNQLRTSMQLILSLWDHELKLPLVSKDKAFSLPSLIVPSICPSPRPHHVSLSYLRMPQLFPTCTSLWLIHLCHVFLYKAAHRWWMWGYYWKQMQSR